MTIFFYIKLSLVILRNFEKMAIGVLRNGHEPCTIAFAYGSTWYYESGTNSSRHPTGHSDCRSRCSRTDCSSRYAVCINFYQHRPSAAVYWTLLFPWYHRFPTFFLPQYGFSRFPPNCRQSASYLQHLARGHTQTDLS